MCEPKISRGHKDDVDVSPDYIASKLDGEAGWNFDKAEGAIACIIGGRRSYNSGTSDRWNLFPAEKLMQLDEAGMVLRMFPRTKGVVLLRARVAGLLDVVPKTSMMLTVVVTTVDCREKKGMDLQTCSDKEYACKLGTGEEVTIFGVCKVNNEPVNLLVGEW